MSTEIVATSVRVTQIAVTGGSPLERVGVASALVARGAHVVDRPTIESLANERLDLLVCVRPNISDITEAYRVLNGIPIVVVLPESAPSAWGVADAIDAGACAFVAADEGAEWLARAVAAALDGLLVLPWGIGRQIVRAIPPAPPMDLSSAERTLLSDLLTEASIEEIAYRQAYSTRNLHRHLSQLYRRLGVSSRIGAVVLASRWNLASDSDQLTNGRSVSRATDLRLEDGMEVSRTHW